MVAAGSYGTTDEIINKIIIDEPSIISDMRVLVGVSDKPSIEDMVQNKLLRRLSLHVV